MGKVADGETRKDRRAFMIAAEDFAWSKRREWTPSLRAKVGRISRKSGWQWDHRWEIMEEAVENAPSFHADRGRFLRRARRDEALMDSRIPEWPASPPVQEHAPDDLGWVKRCDLGPKVWEKPDGRLYQFAPAAREIVFTFGAPNGRTA